MPVFYREEKKIATPLALILLLVILAGLSLAVKKIRTVATQAQKTTTPTIMITNLTNNSAAIVWQSLIKQTGWVIYGEGKDSLKQTALDDRSELSSQTKYRNHHVTLKNLKENTAYFFQIVSDKQVIAPQNSPFSFKTAPRVSLRQNLTPAFGKALNKNGAPLGDGLALLTVEGALPLSALTKSTGEWLIPLYYLIDQTARQPLANPRETPATLTIINESGQKAQARGNLADMSPLTQTVVIGQKLEIKQEKTNVLSSATQKEIAPSNKTEIIFPKENALIPGRRPLFKGVAGPKEMIILSIKSVSSRTTRTFEITSGADGVWDFSVPYDLSAGTYLLQVKTRDDAGRFKTLDRDFTIAQSGEAVLGEATPAAAIVQTPAPTPTAASLPTAGPTVTSAPPVSGVGNLSLPLLGAGLITIGIGFILLF